MTRFLAQRRTVIAVSSFLFLLVLMPGPAARATTSDLREYQRLERDMRSDYRAARYEKALETARKLHEMRPEDPVPMYNIACLHGLLGQKDKTYKWLDRAVEAGYRDADHMMNDFDLRTIRGEDRFRAIVQKIRALQAATADAPKPDDANTGDQSGTKPGTVDDATAGDRKPSAAKSDRELIAQIQDLTEQVIHRADKKEYVKALELAKASLSLAETLGDPRQQSLTNYNVACMHARLRQTDSAIAHLKTSVEIGGFRDDMALQIEQDRDFDSLRKDPRFLEILETIRKQMVNHVDAEMMIVLPNKHDKSRAAPLLVVLHPWGGDMKEIAERWQQVADEIGAILLVPQGTVRLSDTTFRWDEKIDEVEEEVLRAIESVTRQHQVNEKQMIVAGFSQGAWAAYGLVLRNPDMFRGIVAIGGLFDDEFESLARDEDLSNLRAVIMVGKEDEKEILDANRTAEKCLMRHGAKVRHIAYDHLGHDYPKRTNTELKKALEFILSE